MTPTLSRNLPRMVWIRLASLSFYLREPCSAALPLARSLSRIRLGGKSNFFPLTQSNSAAVAVAQHSLPPLLLPRAVVVEAGSEGREEGRKGGGKANILQVEISSALRFTISLLPCLISQA